MILGSLEPFPIIRVNHTARTFLSPLIKTNAEVIERHTVGINTFAAGFVYRNKLRREVQHLSELHFLCLKLLFRMLVLFIIEINSYPTQQSSIAGSERFGAAAEPAVLSFSVTNPLTELTGAASAQTGCPNSPRFFLVVRMQ